MVRIGLCALLLHTPAFAQGVRGIVTSAQDRAPINGAFITLIDEHSYQRAAALSDSAGRFFLRAPAPGTYFLRAERIGYETVTSSPLQLNRDTVTMRFEIPTVPIPLESIEVRGADRACRKRPDAPAVYHLWKAINTALRITTFSQQSASMNFSLFRYMRELDRNGETLFAEERLFLERTGALSFNSIAPHELEAGFMRTGAGERTLHGPDALLLLSDEFQDTHCFGLVRDRKANAIGISFKPMKNVRDVIDIEGVLWADDRTAELRRLTFDYTNLPRDLATTGSRGEVLFRKLPNGHWIVQSWWIRMPLFAARISPRGGFLQAYLRGFSEEGGSVVAVDGRPSSIAGPSASIEGEVIDSMTLEPIANATVFASGTPYQAVTDSLGKYRISNLPIGKYKLAVQTEVSSELAIPVQLREVELPIARKDDANLFSPTISSMFRTLCEGANADVGSGLVYGIVRDSATALPLALAEVRADWRGPTASDTTTTERWRTAKTGSDGRYYLCWMPQYVNIHLSARIQRRVLGSTGVHLGGGWRLRQDFPPVR